jgi:preprotein translocase subunit SecB
MLAEINLTTLASIDESDKKELEKIILIKIPTDVYPVLYETFIYLFKQAGIKDIKIEKEIDFEKMYNEKKNN